jgi:D-glycero-D-manno-heptose 1,7-bisphosphate phosphatase
MAGSRRAVFLDRDGVINRMVYHDEFGLVDSPANPDELELLTGVGEAVRLINEVGLLAIVVSNQPGIAKGKYTAQLLEAMDEKVKTELAKAGAHLDGVYYCLHHPEAINEGYRLDCGCRKPKPGLLFEAGQDFDIDLEHSYVIGDGLTDIQAGKAAGCKTIFLGQWKCYTCRFMEDRGAKPDFIASDLFEAVGLIQRLEGENANLH